MQVRHSRGALHSLDLCVKSPQLQQASFLLGWVQPRETWPYLWHLKQQTTSACSRMPAGPPQSSLHRNGCENYMGNLVLPASSECPLTLENLELSGDFYAPRKTCKCQEIFSKVREFFRAYISSFCCIRCATKFPLFVKRWLQQ